MRLGVCVGATILATASMALAESDWVSDPWPSDGNEASTASPAVPSARAQAFRDSEPAWLGPRGSELESPWASAPAPAPLSATSTPARIDAPVAQTAGIWAKAPTEVVDPWATETRAKGNWVPSIDLIVDPWARGD